jgi:murein DD-endopeptidase MepM/ murein hydrolase activator NlpD
VALTHTPHGGTGLLDPASDDSARRRLPRPTRTSAPVLGVTAMAAALGATGLTATAAAAATAAPAGAAPAVSAPDQADPGLALAARIQQQADVEPGAEDAQQLTAGQDAARAAQQQAARLEAAHEAAAKRAAQQAAATSSPTAVFPVPGHSVDAPAATPWEQLRTGIDISAPAHTPVRAVTAGTVSSVGWSGRYGYRVIQTLPDGTELWYCHLASISATGGELAPGAPLGLVGTTGSGATAALGTAAPRLHLEVRPGGGAPVDALAWLQAHGVAA